MQLRNRARKVLDACRERMLQLALAHPGAAFALTDTLQQRVLLRLPKVRLAQLACLLPSSQASTRIPATWGRWLLIRLFVHCIPCRLHGCMMLTKQYQAQCTICSWPGQTSTCAIKHDAAAQGRSIGDTLALAFGDLAPRMQAAESQHGAVRITLHACVPPSGVASKPLQYTCGAAQPDTVPALHGDSVLSLAFNTSRVLVFIHPCSMMPHALLRMAHI